MLGTRDITDSCKMYNMHTTLVRSFLEYVELPLYIVLHFVSNCPVAKMQKVNDEANCPS